jgi:hypothetical protein
MTIIREEYTGEHVQMEKEYADYQRRARNIDDWAHTQYAAGKLSEFQIERAVERMFDELDGEYIGTDTSYRQTFESVW